MKTRYSSFARILASSALWILLAVSAIAFRPAEVQAASYKAIPSSGSVQKVGKYYFKMVDYDKICYATSKNGNYTNIGQANFGALTNGSDVIYIGKANDMQQLKRYTISSKKTTVLKKFTDTKAKSEYDDPDTYHLDMVYGNVAYLTRNSFTSWKYWEYAYNLKTGKWKKVLTGGHIQDASGKYVIIDHSYRTDVSPTKMSIYQINSSGSLKKVRLIGKYCSSASIVSGKIYYGIYNSSSPKKLTLYRCNANGSGAKKLGTFTAKEEYGMVMSYNYTAKSCYVMIDSKTYKYTYSTKKLSEISGNG